MTSKNGDENVVAPVDVSSDVIASVAAFAPNLTEAQIAEALTAWNTSQSGAPVGTVLRDDDTGAIAHRIEKNGMPMWKVTTPGGPTYNDMRPTLPWTQIYPPVT